MQARAVSNGVAGALSRQKAGHGPCGVKQLLEKGKTARCARLRKTLAFPETLAIRGKHGGPADPCGRRRK